MEPRQGFTLIELLLTLGIVVILAAIVIVAINPASQFALARNTQRWAHVNIIANAVVQNIGDNRGAFTCGGAPTSLPTSTKQMGSGAGNFNIAPCLVPVYTATMPLDPVGGTSTAVGYTILYDAVAKRVTISAPNAELDKVISVTQ